MRVVAIVVNWNGGADTLLCVESLLAQVPPLERVLVVDHASSDGSRERVQRDFPIVEVIETGANLGYSGGNNRGAARARELGADAFLVVNNDVTLEPHCVRELVRALESNERLAAVGPRVLLRDDPTRLWAAGGVLSWRQNLSDLRGFGQRDADEYRRTLEVDYVPGCAVLVRASALGGEELFDDLYFAYTEDVDLGQRLRRAGFASACIGSVRAWHAPSSSTGGGYNPRRKYMMAVNSVHFLRRWGGRREWLRFLAFDVATLPFALADGWCRGHAKAVLAKGLGLWHGLRGRRISAETVKRGATALW